MSFYEKNQKLLESIALKYQEIATLVHKYSDKIPELKYSWWPMFNCIWKEISVQQKWLNYSNNLNNLNLSKYKRKILNILLSLLKVNMSTPAIEFLSDSPILSNTGLSMTFPPDYIVYPTVYGFKLCTSGYDMWQPVATGHYSTELGETLLCLRLSKYISSFIDVGANVGFYSLLVTNESAGRIKVIACEPSSTNFEILKEAINVNDYSDYIQPMKIALSNKVGKGCLHLCLYGSGGHSLDVDNDFFLNNKSEEVVTTTLNSIYDSPDKSFKKTLIKIDVEGSEKKVLEGGKKWLSSHNAPIILYESWPDSVYSKGKNHCLIAKFLRNYNYKIFAIQKSSHEKTPLKEISGCNYFKPSPTGNYLAIPKWAISFIDKLNSPTDMRVFSSTSRLSFIFDFLNQTHENLKKKINEYT